MDFYTIVAWFHTLFFTYVSCCISYLTLLMANIKNPKKFQVIQTIWDVMLYSQHFTFHCKLLGLVSRIEKSGAGDNNFGKWKGTFRSDRPKWPDRSQWTTFRAGPKYSGRTKPKWSVQLIWCTKQNYRNFGLNGKRPLLLCYSVTLLPCYLVTLFPCYLVTLLLCYPVTLLPCYLVALFPCYPVTLSLCFSVTLLPYYPVTLLPWYSVSLLPCYLATLLLCPLVTLIPCYLVTLLPCYLDSLLLCYFITFLLCYLVTLLPCCLVTLLPCYLLTLLLCYHVAL